MKKTPWLNDEGNFQCRTCVTLAAYVFNKTGIKVQVHKTERYLVFNYIKDGQLQTTKIKFWPSVLYCLHEEDLKPLMELL